MLIQLTDQRALKLLKELEALHLIKVLKKEESPVPIRLSGKYKGIMSKKEGKKLNKHIKEMRSEWSNT